MKYFTKIRYSWTKVLHDIVVGECFKIRSRYLSGLSDHPDSHRDSVMLFLRESYFFYKILVTQLNPRNLNLIYLMKSDSYRIDFNKDHFLPSTRNQAYYKINKIGRRGSLPGY